ncbi:hypothetical protein TGME49_225870 [Toxoplasma gondii ME49]|uniref:Uncharacterized protein n=1 Tax=Toxoplasma gondii (strain ATCC 50611 / Me49) TaxID=508771 RepID=S8G5V4_TOXGM|nr:hypothetical protein TGME49_225870 [Toxoplasma gondii ME49]EPT27085.1 hypothetical protein TGME49_225870 [Toxoplasma gondii ME49]|eukprot:XP_018636009.1 hypothetical protein TGME49_225870 [Toxoplasma gondii ME49]
MTFAGTGVGGLGVGTSAPQRGTQGASSHIPFSDFVSCNSVSSCVAVPGCSRKGRFSEKPSEPVRLIQRSGASSPQSEDVFGRFCSVSTTTESLLSGGCRGRGGHSVLNNGFFTSTGSPSEVDWLSRGGSSSSHSGPECVQEGPDSEEEISVQGKRVGGDKSVFPFPECFSVEHVFRVEDREGGSQVGKHGDSRGPHPEAAADDISCASTAVDLQRDPVGNTVDSQSDTSPAFIWDTSSRSKSFFFVTTTSVPPGTTCAAADLQSRTGARALSNSSDTGVLLPQENFCDQEIPQYPSSFSIPVSPPFAASAHLVSSDERRHLLSLLRRRYRADLPRSKALLSEHLGRLNISNLSSSSATELWMVARLLNCEQEASQLLGASCGAASLNPGGRDCLAEDGSPGRGTMDAMKTAEVPVEREASGGPLEMRTDQDAAPTAAQTPQFDPALNRDSHPYPVGSSPSHVAPGMCHGASSGSRNPGNVADRRADEGQSVWAWSDSSCPTGTASSSSSHTSPHAPHAHSASDAALGCAQVPLPEPRATEILADVAYGSPPAPALVPSPPLQPADRFNYSPGQPTQQVPLDSQWWMEGDRESHHSVPTPYPPGDNSGHPNISFMRRGPQPESLGSEPSGFRTAPRGSEIGASDAKGHLESGSPALVMLPPVGGPAGPGSRDSVHPGFAVTPRLPGVNFGGTMHHQGPHSSGILIHTPPHGPMGYPNPVASRAPGDHQQVLQLPDTVGGPANLPGLSGGVAGACPAPGAFLQSSPMGPQHHGGMMPSGMPSPYCMSSPMGARPSSPLPNMVAMGSVMGPPGSQASPGSRPAVVEPNRMVPSGMGMAPGAGGADDSPGGAAAKGSPRRSRKKPSPRPVDGSFGNPSSPGGVAVAGGNPPLPGRPPAPQHPKRSRKRGSAANAEGGADPQPRQPRPWQHTARCKKSGRFCTREEAAQAAAEAAAAAAEGSGEGGEKSGEAAKKSGSDNAPSAQGGASGNGPPKSGTGSDGSKESSDRFAEDGSRPSGGKLDDTAPKQSGTAPQAGSTSRVTGGKSRSANGSGAGAGNEGSTDANDGAAKTTGADNCVETASASGEKEEQPESKTASTPRKRRRIRKDAEAKNKGVSADRTGTAGEAPRSPVQSTETAQPFSGCGMKPEDSGQFRIAPGVPTEGVCPQGVSWGVQQQAPAYSVASRDPGACLPYAAAPCHASASVRYGMAVATRPQYSSYPYMSSVYPGPGVERSAGDLQIECDAATPASPATGAAPPCQAPLSSGSPYGSLPYDLDHTGQPLAGNPLRPAAPTGSGSVPPGSSTPWSAQSHQAYGASPGCHGMPQARQMGECGVENGAYVGQGVPPHSQGMPISGGFELPYPQMGSSWGSTGNVPNQVYPSSSRPEEGEDASGQGQHVGHSEFSPVKPEMCSSLYPPTHLMQDWRPFHGDVLGSQPGRGSAALGPSAPNLSSASPGGDSRDCLMQMPGSRGAPGAQNPPTCHLQAQHIAGEHADSASPALRSNQTGGWVLTARGCEGGDSGRGPESASSTTETGSASRAVIMGLGTEDGEDDPARERQDEDGGLFQRSVPLSPLLSGYHPLL